MNNRLLGIAIAVATHLKNDRKSRDEWSERKRIRRNMLAYKRGHGYIFDINNPETFTEKIQWYKLFYTDNRLKTIVDKYDFKEYVKHKLGDNHTIEVYGCWESIEDLEQDWIKLPQQFCLKSTISSEGSHILPIMLKEEVSFDLIKREVAPWLDKRNTMINSYCRAYYNTKPRVLAEKYVSDIDNQLNDYKIFCFDGKPYFIYVAVDYKSGTDSPIVFYDLNWRKLDIRYGNHRTDINVKKPKNLSAMLKYARVLSEGFPFVRVDFFDTNKKVYVAEMTFYPGGGLIPYYPKTINEEMGKLFFL